jgi:hypothetical protein
MGLKDIGWDDVNRINVAQDRENLWAVVNKVMNLWIE